MSITDGLTDFLDIQLVLAADGLAAQAHAGQTDKAGHPYVEHVRRVAMRIDSGWGRAVALLHDTLEDTNLTEHDMILAGMPREVREAVIALTHHKTGESRADYYARIRVAGPMVVEIKLADIADNSDPERLAKLDAATRERLEHKYAVARAALTGK